MEVIRRRTLDLGAGSGSLSGGLMTDHVVNVDSNQSLVGVGARFPNVTAVCADGFNLPIRDGSFDKIKIIFPLQTLLEGLENGTIYPELARVSRPDTTLQVVFDGAGSPMSIVNAARPHFLLTDWKNPTLEDLNGYGTLISRAYAHMYRSDPVMQRICLNFLHELNFKNLHTFYE